MLPRGPQIDKVDDCNSVLKKNNVSTVTGQKLLVSYVKGVTEGVEVHVSGLWFSVSLMSADIRNRNRLLKKGYV